MQSIAKSFSKNTHAIWYIFFISALVHIILIWISIPYSNYDLVSYRLIGEKILHGVNIYPLQAAGRHPYFPLFLYIEAITLLFASKTVSQIILLKIVFSAFNMGIIYLVYLLSKKNAFYTFLYAFNPVSLLITCFQGQFDSIPVFFILLSIFLLNKKTKTYALLSLSAAIAFKTWPILFVIPILKRMNRTFSMKRWGKQVALLFIFPLFATLIYCLLFRVNPLFVAKVVLSYGGVLNVWGLGKGLHLLFGSNKLLFFFFKVLCVLGVLLFQARNKEKSLFFQLFMSLLLFFIITPGFGIQYFFWLIPFAFLSGKMGWKEYISILCSVVVTYLAFAGLLIPQIWREVIYFFTWMTLSLCFLENKIYPLLK